MNKAQFTAFMLIAHLLRIVLASLLSEKEFEQVKEFIDKTISSVSIDSFGTDLTKEG